MTNQNLHMKLKGWTVNAATLILKTQMKKGWCRVPDTSVWIGAELLLKTSIPTPIIFLSLAHIFYSLSIS